MVSYSEIFSNTWAIILVLLFFGGSIFVHELGHFLAAKARGLKVLRFSIGFGPKLLAWKGRDGCKYMVSLLPFGGYVALPQLADMGALEGGDDSEGDMEIIRKLPKASVSDKIIVSAAGAFFNILFAAALAAVVWAAGIPESQAYKTTTIGYVPEKITDAGGVELKSPAFESGIKAGDKIVSIDGVKVDNFMQIIERIAIGSGRDKNGNPSADVKIERDGKIMDFKLSPVLIKTNTATGDSIRMIGVSPAMQMKVGQVMKNSPAEKSGVKKGDEVIAINNQKLYSNQQLSEILEKLEAGSQATLKVLRSGKKTDLKIFPQPVKLTHSLCLIELPKKEGSISVIATPANPASKTSNAFNLRVFEVKTENEALKNILPGSLLYEMDDKPVKSLSDINTIVNAVSPKGHVKLSVVKDGIFKDYWLPRDSSSRIIPPKTKMMLGYMLENVVVVSHPNILEQFSDSIERTYNALSSLLNPKSDIGISSLAGPVDIGRVIYKLSLSDFSLVLSFAVLLNINLAFLNMLPIPVLDGGHIIFALLEKLRGKPLPPNFFAAIQGGFSLLFISLMVYVVYIGFARWKGDSDMAAADEIQSAYYIKDISFKSHE